MSTAQMQAFARMTTCSLFAIASLLLLSSSQLVAAAEECPDAKQTLELHNVYRRAHGADPLTWYQPAVDKAQEWAQHLADNDCNLEHSTFDWRDGMGENLYASWGNMSTSCVDATNEWYAEVTNYKFGSSTPYTTNEGNFGEWGHFTQLVWRGTYGVGCARATGNNCCVISCNYQKPGNIMTDEDFAANVKPVSKSNAAAAVKMGKAEQFDTSRIKSSKSTGRKLLRAASAWP